METEAYRADDPASHSCRGETPRAAIMFGEPGVAYVYFIYGMYEMLNFVTEPRGQAGAVLIRAIEPLDGQELMSLRRLSSPARARSLAKSTQSNSLKDPGARPTKSLRPHELASGPGKLCRAFGIQLAHNRASLRGPELFVKDDGYRPASISVSPRVGITQAKEKLWRYFITDHPCLSRAPQNAEAEVMR